MTHPLTALIAGVPRFCNTSDALMAEDPMGAYVHWHDLIAALEAAPHVNETPKTEHDGADMLTNAAQARAVTTEVLAALEAAEAERDYTHGTNEVLRGENQRLEATAATLRAEVERLRGRLQDMVAVAAQDGWDKAMTGRQLIIADARAALEGKA